jgi:small GTP-binding protein
MTTAPIRMLDGPITTLREREIKLINEIADSLIKVDSEAEESRQRIKDVAQDLQDMFFIVSVIGEFNAGKSTFINALVGETLLPTGIKPTTEYIELIRYSSEPNRKPVVRADGLREWAHPNIGTDGVAIVDTPGTGSIFQKHGKTAKDFLHRSDLVIFVISAKRAFGESERLYLELAKDYGKKIILVLNQMDLLTPAEQAEVKKFVEDRVQEFLNIQPLLFATSSKAYFENTEADSMTDSSGILAVRAHLRGVYQEAPPAKQKLLTQLATAEKITESVYSTVQKKLDTVSLDTERIKDIENELEQQSLGLDKQMAEAKAEIDTTLENIRIRGLTFINQHLSIRKLRTSSSKDDLQTEFQNVVIGRSLKDINKATNDYINAVIDQSRMYWRGVIDRLNKLQDMLEKEVEGLDAGIYSEQRESLQDAIRIAEAELKSYSTGKVISDMEGAFNQNMTGFQRSVLASTGSIITALVAIATPGPLFGLAAAPLALPAFIAGAVGAVVFGVPAYQYYRKVNRETREKFNGNIDKLEKNYHEALDDLMTKERSRLNQYGKQVLTPIFSRLDVLAKRFGDHDKQLKGYLDDLADLRERIEAIN